MCKQEVMRRVPRVHGTNDGVQVVWYVWRRGTAEIRDGRVVVTVPGKLDFAWFRLH